MDWIDEIIAGVEELYNSVDPYELCRLLKIEIVRTEPDNPILLENESLYIRDFLGREVIFIRNDLHKSHESFYLLHELAHALLHPDIKNSLNSDLVNKDKLEKQAYYFALKLSKVSIDEIELYQITLEQIASCLELPYKPLKQLVNLQTYQERIFS